MSCPTTDDLIEAAKAIEAITGVPTKLQMKKSRKERLAEKERIRRFLALPPQLQEGILRYGEHLQKTYRT
ncbi:MAG: hypothetical protein JRI81_13510 [Deltaproteobacteria bacterium]|nr:hypothetical protein [Deltaproteobacteria bacterium]